MIMPQHTEESLNQLLKRALIPIVLSLDDNNRSMQYRKPEMNNKVLEERRKFPENFSKFQSELSITCKYWNDLTDHSLQSQFGENDQYSRKERVEVVVIPCQADEKHLEPTVLLEPTATLLLNSWRISSIW